MNKAATKIKNEVRQLFTEQLAGSLTEKQASRLKFLLDNDTTAKQEYTHLKSEVHDIHASEFINGIDTERDLKDLHVELRRRKRKRRRTWVSAAAAAVIIGLAAGSLMTHDSVFESKLATAPPEPQSPIGDKVELLMGNGASVVLNESGVRDLQVGGLTLKTSGNKLEGVEGKVSDELNTLFVPVREDYQITLDDGTKVWINSASTLKFPFRFSGDTREVYLEGEAYFEVEKNTKKPFIVHTKAMHVQVHGTHFNVCSYPGSPTKAELMEGSISVSGGARTPVVLRPGYQAVLDSTDAFNVSKFNPKEALSWKEGILYFHNEPLRNMTGVFSRWFGLRMEFGSSEVAQIRITGLLEKDDLNSFIEYLKASEIQCELNGDSMLLN